MKEKMCCQGLAVQFKKISNKSQIQDFQGYHLSD